MFIASQNVLDYTKEMDIDAVLGNRKIPDETVKNISKEFQKKYSDIEWSIIAKTRDRLIHFYSGIDLETVWKIVTGNISSLKQKPEKIIRNEGWEDEL